MALAVGRNGDALRDCSQEEGKDCCRKTGSRRNVKRLANPGSASERNTVQRQGRRERFCYATGVNIGCKRRGQPVSKRSRVAIVKIGTVWPEWAAFDARGARGMQAILYESAASVDAKARYFGVSFRNECVDGRIDPICILRGFQS